MTPPRTRKWGPTTQKLFRLPDGMLERLNALARMQGLSTNDVVVHALNNELDDSDAWLDRLRFLPQDRKLSMLDAIIATIARELENPE